VVVLGLFPTRSRSLLGYLATAPDFDRQVFRGLGMKWTIKYATGIESIDRQHKMLFRMSEDYRESLDGGQGERMYGLLLESLDRYASAHFGSEEQCMNRYQCPVAEENGAAHAKFTEALAGFRKRYATGGFDVGDARQLVEYVDQWLDSHIGRIDVQLKPCVENRQP
jgi:hemerythrin